MPTFYNVRDNGVDYDFEDIFVPVDLFRSGNLWGWGNEFFLGILGASFVGKSTPLTTFAGGNNWKQVSAGEDYVAAIKTDGTLWMWGDNSYGQLGNRRLSNYTTTPITTFAGGNNWKQVSVSVQHTVAIKTDGTLWTWGLDSSGKLGNARDTGGSWISTPITTFAGGTNWKQAVAGTFSTLAIKTDGTLWGWGANTIGNLGNAQITNVSTPVTTFAGGNNWKQVTAGSTAAAIKTDGTLWTWGYGNRGRLGNATSTGNRSTPVTTFAGGNNWKQVSGGGDFILAIKTDGTLWGWGHGVNGSLGNGATAFSAVISTPVTTFAGGNNWKQVNCGAHSAAIKTDGTLWMWGSGFSGQLGNAQITSRSTPVTTFAGGNKWYQVSPSVVQSRFTTSIIYDDPVI